MNTISFIPDVVFSLLDAAQSFWNWLDTNVVFLPEFGDGFSYVDIICGSAVISGVLTLVFGFNGNGGDDD